MKLVNDLGAEWDVSVGDRVTFGIVPFGIERGSVIRESADHVVVNSGGRHTVVRGNDILRVRKPQ